MPFHSADKFSNEQQIFGLCRSIREVILFYLLLGVLLALGDGVHDMVAAAAQRRHFVEEGDVKRKPELVLESQRQFKVGTVQLGYCEDFCHSQ